MLSRFIYLWKGESCYSLYNVSFICFLLLMLVRQKWEKTPFIAFPLKAFFLKKDTTIKKRQMRRLQVSHKIINSLFLNKCAFL